MSPYNNNPNGIGQSPSNKSFIKPLANKHINKK